MKVISFMGDLHMVAVAQLVRVSGCGPGGRGFESHQPPHLFKTRFIIFEAGFLFYHINLKTSKLSISERLPTKTLNLPFSASNLPSNV